MFVVQCSGFPLERGMHKFTLTLISVSGDCVRKIRVMIIKSRKTVEGRHGEVKEVKMEKKAKLLEEPRRE